MTADAHGTKVLVGGLAAEVRSNRRCIRAALSAQEREAILAGFSYRLPGVRRFKSPQGQRG